jgi:hypothetical protein
MTFTNPENRKERLVVILDGVPEHVEALGDNAKLYFNDEEWDLS